MKIILFLFAFLLFPISDSFGAYQTEIGDDLFIFVQSTIRNSDGVLIAYLESSKFSVLNKPELESYLDFEASIGNDPIITIDAQNYQIIRRVQYKSIGYDGLVAGTILSNVVDGKPTTLARFSHDGFSVVSGDIMESMWTFVRPVS